MKATILILNDREPTESLERKFQQISLTAKKEDPSPSVEKKLPEGKSSTARETSKDIGDLYCKPCQKPFTGYQSKMEHLKSEKHKRKVEMSESAPQHTTTERDSPDKQDSRELKCEVCQKSFTGVESMREHEQSEKHRRKVETGKVSPPSNTVDEKQNSDKHLKKVSQARLGSVPALECKPCQKVFTGPESLAEHLKSKKHLNMVKCC